MDKSIKLNQQEIQIISEGLNKQQQSLEAAAKRYATNDAQRKVFGDNIQAIRTLRERINL